MEEPTQEQIKEFWEWCGCKIVSFPFFLDKTKPVFDVVFSDKREQRCHNLAETIDPNNIWKYALPKLQREYRNWKSVLYDWLDELDDDWSKDPAIALFWAIWGVIKDD